MKCANDDSIHASSALSQNRSVCSLKPPVREIGTVGRPAARQTARKWAPFLPWLGCILLCGTTALASAQSPTDFQRGLAALARDDAPAAVDAFTRALAEQESAAGWFNLGLAQTRLGDPQAAWLAFDAYLSAADASTEAERIRIAQAEVERLRSSNTVLVVEVEPASEEILIDGRPTWTKNDLLLMTPGQHRIELKRHGHHSLRRTVDLPTGRFRLTARLSPMVTPAIPVEQDNELPPGMAGPAADDSHERQTEPPAPAHAADPPLDVASVDATPLSAAPAPERACLFAGRCVEASLVLGLPNAVGLGLGVRLHPLVSVALSAHVLPSITIDGTSVYAHLWTVSGRVHPFSNGLFASAGLALQRIFARRDNTIATATAELNLPMLSFGIGYMGTSGFSIGIDGSLLIELRNSPLRVQQINSPDEAALQEELQEETTAAIDELRQLLPVAFQVNLLRVGYVF